MTPSSAWPAAAPPQSPASPGQLQGPAARPGFLRGRRGLAITGAVALLVVAAVASFVVLREDGDGSDDAGSSGGSARRSAAPAAAGGREIPLLDGRLVLVAPEGWEQRDSSPDSASVKVELRLPGRDLVATLVTSALPPGGGLDGLLTADGATRFEVDTKGAGLLQASVVPPTGNVRAAASRPNAVFFLTLGVFALDGQPLDGPLLQKLFTEQVASQLRIP